MAFDENTKPGKRSRKRPPARSKAAIAALVAKNVGLVGFYARSYMATGFLSFDDFVGEGYLALVNAAKQWPGHRSNFNNYAAVCIRRALEHAVQAFKRHGDVVHRQVGSTVVITYREAMDDDEYTNKIFTANDVEAGSEIDLARRSQAEDIDLAVSKLTHAEYQAFRLTTATLGIDSRRSIRQAAGEMGLTVEETQAAVDRAREKLRAALASQ